MRSRLISVDVRGGSGQVVYTSGPGLIHRAIPLRGGKRFVVIEQDPELAIWPMSSVWGRVCIVTPGVGRREVAMEPVPAQARLFASDHPDVFFLAEVLRTSRTSLFGVYEINAATGRRIRLNPGDLAATDVAVSADGTTLAAVLENVATPPEVYVWTRAARRWRKLTDHGAAYPKLDVGPVEHITWRSKDNRFDIDGILVKPRDFDPAKKYPLLVGLAGGNSTHTTVFKNLFNPRVGVGVMGPPAHIFAAEGYLVLLANHRHSAYAGFEQNKAIIGHYGDHVTLDVEAGVDALIAKGWVNRDQLGVVGWSHGGDEVSYLLSHTTRYKAAVINEGPLALPEVVVPRIEIRATSPRREEGREVRRQLVGYDQVQTLWADPFKIRTPLLMRWGGRGRQGSPDGLEHPAGSGSVAHISWQEQTYKLLYALQGNRVPVDVIIDRDHHGVDPTGKYMLEYQSRLLQWFDYFLLGKGANPIPAMRTPLDYSDEVRTHAATVSE
jgi:hypothetical protein